MEPLSPCPVPLSRSLAALRMECGALDPLVENLRPADLGRPTRLGDWTLQVLLAHIVRGVDRLRAYLAAPVPPEAEVTWLTYWDGIGDATAEDVSRRARSFVERIQGRPIPAVWDEASRRSIEEAEACDPDRLLLSPFGGIRLDHYATTRVLELTVHGLDVRRSLDLEEVATPLALEVSAAVLEARLGGRRPDGLRDDVEFVLAATGREPHPDPDLPTIS